GRNPRRPVEHESRPDPCLIKKQLRLQKLELKSDRAKVLAQQELAVLKSELVGRALGLRDRRNMLRGTGVDLGSGEDALWRQRLLGHAMPPSVIQLQRHAAGDASLIAPQSIRRVAYITPASAAKS